MAAGAVTRPCRPAPRRLALALLLLACGPSGGDEPRADLRDLKAAYLYNFAQFAEWPREPGAAAGDAEFAICATGRDSLGGSLGALQGRTLRGRPVVALAPVQNADEARRCHILYVDDARAGWVRQVAERPVLLVGNVPEAAGLAIAFEVRGERLRWHVNLAAARKSGLRLSSKLVELALSVTDTPAERP
jgi:hypothetical protein